MKILISKGDDFFPCIYFDTRDGMSATVLLEYMGVYVW